MPNYSSFTVIGHLTRAPELRTTQGGMQVVKTGIAYNNRKKEASFFDVVAFGKTAELIANTFEKGDAVGFSGELNIETFPKRDGSQGMAVVVTAREIIFMGGGGRQDRGQQPRQQADDYATTEPDEPAY
jgi:single-strand DNA-binding protein